MLARLVALGGVVCLAGCARPGVSTAPTELADIVLPDDPTVPLPVDGRVRVGSLPNGLTYYIEPNQR
ncbi:MAG: hypothetical protein KC656_34605, partial [Myxococcales bacterium]|nr:hypothetical protein [Myxococcales bacterium]